jgi:murein DD-endopeptidase MepM/ murein hydrolase activator NlpD
VSVRCGRAGAILLFLGLVLGLVTGCAVLRGRDDTAALHARRLMVPVAGVRPEDVPDTFADTRDAGRRRHAALDIPSPRGTPVLSVDDGIVLAVRDNRRGGRTVYACDPGRRFVYYYAHLDRRRPDLRAGSSLARGDVLGTVGTTGNADGAGPHLHFQVMVYPDDGRWWDGRPVDPRPFLALAGRARQS